MPRELDCPYRCPKCDYDLRGSEHFVCPECGQATNPDEAAVAARSYCPWTRPVRRLRHFVWAWFVAYFVLFPVFGTTVDHVRSFVIKIVFLNLPLQLILFSMSLALLRRRNRRSARLGAILLVCLLMVILVGFSISIYIFVAERPN